MAPKTTPRKSRSRSRAPSNPTTKAQRLTRVQELTERIIARQTDVEDLGAERNRIVDDLREIDGATYQEIADAAGTSSQALHKAHTKRALRSKR